MSGGLSGNIVGSLFLSVFASTAPPNHLTFSATECQARTAPSEDNIALCWCMCVRKRYGAWPLQWKPTAKVNGRKTQVYSVVDEVV